MTFRTGRIWRLGEKELVVRKYNPPKRLELHCAREDENPHDLAAIWRNRLEVQAGQLTSPAWHEYWGRHGVTK